MVYSEMTRYDHGGRYSDDVLYDFSVNINPLGMPDGVKKALAESIDKFAYYPDTASEALVKKLSEKENIPEKNIACGCGAADLIYRLVYALKPENALLIAPSFSEYEKALSEVGCGINYHYLSEENNFALTESILDDIEENDILFLCEPNNPTGRITDRKLLEKIAEKCRICGTFLAVDNCFMDFADKNSRYNIRLNKNIGIIKAFTKFYAMAGLRLGYMLFGDENTAQRVQKTGQCWSVSVPAQTAGAAALSETEYAEKTVVLIRTEREYLSSELSKLGIKVYPSEADFILFRCGTPLEKKLLERKISVRSCKNYIGLNEEYYRIAVKLHEENEYLITSIKTILNEEK